MGTFRRGPLNIIHAPWVKAKMAEGVSSTLKRRVSAGLVVGRPRRGEAVEDERYVGLTHEGKQIIAGHHEGMTIRELAKLVAWPKSSVHNFLKRNKERLGK